MNKNTKEKQKKVFRAAAVAGCMVILMAMPAMAAGDEVTKILGNLINILFSIITLVGVIALIWGFVQLVLAINGHDPSQRIQSFLTLAGGLLLVFIKSILVAIGVPI